MPSPISNRSDRRHRRASIQSFDSRANSPFSPRGSRSRSRSNSVSRHSERSRSRSQDGSHVGDRHGLDAQHDVGLGDDGNQNVLADGGQAEDRIPYEKAVLLRKIVAFGMPKQEAKALRELFPEPLFEGSFSLQCPAIENVFSRRLRKARGKKQDYWEKSWLSAQYKALDLARPLLELWRRMDKNDPNYRFIDSAIRLWGVAFNDMTKQRRFNIIRQTDPDYLAMLSDPRVFSERESNQLFGDRFLQALSKEAERDATFKKIERDGAGSSKRYHPYGKRGDRSGGSGRTHHQHSSYNSGNNGSSSNSGGSRSGYGNGNRYVPFSLIPPDDFVGGRLMFFTEAWSSISNDPWILSTVSQGPFIDFATTPAQLKLPPQLFLSEEMTNVGNGEVENLLNKGAISLVFDERKDAFYSNLFMVPKKPTGWRPVINLRGVNRCIRYEHFKMEGLEAAKQLIRPNDWFLKLDLRDAYFTVPMREDYKHLLRFCWGGRRFQFECLPFGLSPAPLIFTKLLKPVVAFLREKGIRLVLYLDDFLFMNESAEGVRRDFETAVSLLLALGFLIKWEKSVTEPSQVMEFLGMTFDSIRGLLTLPQRKISETIALCESALTGKQVKIRDLSVLMGHFAWAIPTVPFAQVHYRNLQRCFISYSKMYDGVLSHKVSLPLDAKEDLLWWKTTLERAGGKPFFISDPDLILYSDASGSGWGGHCNGSRTRGSWTAEELDLHINERELLAAYYVLLCFTEGSRGIQVDIYLDNFSAVCYINKGGGTVSRRMTELAFKLLDWCESRQISIRAFHLPGKENVIADEESRSLPDASDWRLCPQLFKRLERIWEMEIDLFASSWNSQLSRFASWFPQPGAEFVNAFSVSWNDLRAYIFPPFSLIPRCLSKIRREKAEVVFVCPYWPSRPYFPVLLELASDVPRILPFRPDLLQNSVNHPHSLVSSGSLLLIAWRLSGDGSTTEAFRRRWSHSSLIATERPHLLLTRRRGTIGALGVWKGVKIPCVLI